MNHNGSFGSPRKNSLNRKLSPSLRHMVHPLLSTSIPGHMGLSESRIALKILLGWHNQPLTRSRSMDTNIPFRSPRIGLLKEMSSSIEHPCLSSSLPPPCVVAVVEERSGAVQGDDSVFTDPSDSTHSSPCLSRIRRSFSTDTGLSDINCVTSIPGHQKVEMSIS